MEDADNASAETETSEEFFCGAICLSLSLAVVVIVALICILVYVWYSNKQNNPKTLQDHKNKLDLAQLPSSNRVEDWVADNSIQSIKSSVFVENEGAWKTKRQSKHEAIETFLKEKDEPSTQKGRRKATIKSKQSITLTKPSDNAKTSQKPPPKSPAKRHSIKPSPRWSKHNIPDTPTSPPKNTSKEKWKKPTKVNADVINIDGILNKQIYLQELGRHILKGGDPKLFQEKYNIHHRERPSLPSDQSRNSRPTRKLHVDSSSVGSSSKSNSSSQPSNYTFPTSIKSYGSRTASRLQKTLSFKSTLASEKSRPHSVPQSKLELKVMKLLNPVTSDGSLDNLAQMIGASYQFIITGKENTGCWYIDFKGGSGVFGAGALPSPDVTFTMEYDLAMKILERKVKIAPQIMMGNIKIKGDKRKMFKFELFLKKLDAHQKKHPTIPTMSR